jgi:DNA-binding protein HU-beta
MTTKSDLIGDIAVELGHPKATTKEVVDAAFAYIGDALAAGQKVQIAGFGSFEAKPTAARIGRNPATGEQIDIPAGTKVAFKASSELKASL